MATKTKTAAKTPKAAEPKEITSKTVIEGGITQFIEKAGMEGQKARYKAQRAIAYQAFLESVEAQDFEDLIERALENIEDLPSGWSIAPKKAAKKTEPVVEDIEEDEDLEDEAEAEEADEVEEADEDEADEDTEEEEAPAKKPARRRAAHRRRK